MVDSSRIGSLDSKHFGFIESILMKQGVVAPIVTPDLVDDESRNFISPRDLSAKYEINAWKTRFQISVDVQHCFVLSANANAFAAYTPAVPNTYYIAIFLGALQSNVIFPKLIAHPAVRRLLGLPESLGEIDHPDEVVVLSTMVTSAFLWLVNHELAHIKNGHLHLSNRISHGMFSAEAMQLTNLQDNNLTQHTLEMDADSFASGRMVSWIIGYSAQHPHHPVLNNNMGAFRLFILSLYAIMRTFDRADWSVDNLLAYSHPPALIRCSSLATWGGAFLQQKPGIGIDLQSWLAEAAECIFAAEEALTGSRILQNHGDLRGFFFDGSERAPWNIYSDRMLSRWSKLRPELLPHLLGGVLAPAQASPL
ncbi:hypothetical protein [Tardiphaga sp.]|uniref:hypothetical protein n=1 Tax=Tardiphaga sp. TaxID=1926292 RepID=UPI00262F4BB8|nr:hypothetical protein [Tardiphaga sp.]MDB5616246.1 hypothetical protein [Tardiphaga sp.]